MFGARARRGAPQPTLLGLCALTVLLCASGAEARICGDDVDGVRVPCACGDVVVSDTMLNAGDPVVKSRCPIDGLIVRAPTLADSISVNLGGFAIVGSSIGHGIRVESGGSDGARISGGTNGASAEIVGFGTGIVVSDASVLSRLDNVVVKGSKHDGLRLRASGAVLVNVAAEDNGGDGVSISGNGGRLVGVRASGNAGSGIRLVTRRTIVEATADDNGRHGVVSDGGGNDLSKVTARNNGGHGVIARGGRHRTGGLRAVGNLGENLVQTRPEMSR